MRRTLEREEDLLGLDVGNRVEELLDLGRRAVELKAEVNETLGDGSHLRLSDVTTDPTSHTMGQNVCQSGAGRVNVS